MRRATYVLCCSMIALGTGCANWNGGSYPLQNMSRVPPPGTGSYNIPNNYYNNSASIGAQTSMVPTGVPEASQFTASGSVPDGTASVVPAQFAAAAPAPSPVTTGSSPLPSTNMAISSDQFQFPPQPVAIPATATQSLSDSPPNLQWQP